MIKTFIGIPFVDRGRDKTGSDCYGILKMYYKEILDIEIEEIIADPNRPKQCYVKYLDQIARKWEKVETPEPHSVVAMSTNMEHPEMITHFGVMIDNKRMLHTFKNTQSHIINIDNPMIKSQIKGFYKWLS